MRLRIVHATHYEYSEPLKHAIQTLTLTPRSSEHQTVEHWHIEGPGRLFESVDGHGNITHTCTLSRRSVHGRVEASGAVRTHASPWLVDAEGAPPAQLYLRATPLTRADGALSEFACQTLASADASPEGLLRLAAAVCRRVRYERGHTGVHTTASQAFDAGRGVCQDQAHVFIAACRSLGLAARYVSGYFHAPDAADLASHAWADVCVDPGARSWLSVDVTHQCLVDARHVRLAQGADYAACAPVRGVRSGGGQERMRVQVHIFPEV